MTQQYFQGDVVFIQTHDHKRFVVIDNSYFDKFAGGDERNKQEYSVVFLNNPCKGFRLSWITEKEIKRKVGRLSPKEVHKLKLHYWEHSR